MAAPRRRQQEQEDTLEWQHVDSKRNRHAWTRLQRSLARTLGDIQSICEADCQADLVETTARYLERAACSLRQGASRQQRPLHSGLGPAAGASNHEGPDAAAAAAAAAAGCAAAGCRLGRAAPGSAGLSNAVVAHHLALQCANPGSSDADSGADGLSSCSSISISSTLSYPSCMRGASRGSTPSSGSPGSAAASMPWRSGSPVPGQLHYKLSSPDRLRRTPSETRVAAEERHARADRLRAAMAEERMARLKQEQLAKQQRREAGKDDGASRAVARSADKHQRSEALRAAHLGRIRAKAGDEVRKVEEVSFINSLNSQAKRIDLENRLSEGEARRAEALAAILARQQGAAASVKEAAQRRRQQEAERLQQLADKQRRKDEAKAKMEEERQAAAAAREAAKAAARAVAQQREAARQQQAAWLNNRINARLKEAAQRRLQHLEVIRERAALGKDFERRDSLAAASPRTRCASPAAAAGPGGGDQGGGCPEDSGAGAASAAVCAAPASKLNAAAPCFCPSAASGASRGACRRLQIPGDSSGGGRGADGGRPGALRPGVPAPLSPPAAAPLPAEALQQLDGNSQSLARSGITPASSVKGSKKGARRRISKARRKLLQGGCFLEPEQVLLLGSSPEAQQLLADWSPLLAVLGVQPPQLRCAPTADTEGAGVPSAAPQQQQQQPGEGSLLSQGAAMSPSSSEQAVSSARSSPSKHADRRACTGGPCSCAQSSCGSGNDSGVRCAPPAAERLSTASRQEALGALVDSALAHLAKSPLLASHLARQTGLLHLLCKEALAVVGEAPAASGCPPGATAQATSGRGGAAVAPKAQHDNRVQQARMLELLARLLELPANLDFLLACGALLPCFAKAALSALDLANSLDADEPAMATGGDAACRLGTLLHVLVAVMEHRPASGDLVDMQEELVGFMVAAGTLGRLADVLSLFDQPMKEAARPVPPHVLLCLRLLRGITAVRRPAEALLEGRRWPTITPNAAAIVLELQATAMGGVLRLLTAVLLNAAPTCTPGDASCKALPSNFCEAAVLAVGVLNNAARLDLLAAQHMLGCRANRLELFHLLSFLLSYCASRWPAAAAAAAPPPPLPRPAPCSMPPAEQWQQPREQQQQQPGERQPWEQQLREQQSRQQSHRQQPPLQQQQGPHAATCPPACSAGSRPAPGAHIPGGAGWAGHAAGGCGGSLRHPIRLLCSEVLLLLGYFTVQNPSNQAMLAWGRAPNILQRLCSMSQQFEGAPALRQVAMPTLLAVCYGCERTCQVVARHTSLEPLLQFVQQERQQRQRQPPRGGQCQAEAPAGAELPPGELRRSTSGGFGGQQAAFALARRFPLQLLGEAETFLRACSGSSAAST